MTPRLAALLLALVPLAACGGPSLETQTFELRYIHGSTAADMVRPYVYEDRPKAAGRLSVAERALSVRETHDNLERIARVLAEYDRPSRNVRLLFQVIRADGAAAPDSAIAAIESQLRQLFRFRGYRLDAQTAVVAAAGTAIKQRVDGASGRYQIEGALETIGVQADSGAVRLAVLLHVEGVGPVLETRLTVRIGQTAVIGGQPGGGPGALILAVRPELAP